MYYYYSALSIFSICVCLFFICKRHIQKENILFLLSHLAWGEDTDERLWQYIFTNDLWSHQKLNNTLTHLMCTSKWLVLYVTFFKVASRSNLFLSATTKINRSVYPHPPLSTHTKTSPPPIPPIWFQYTRYNSLWIIHWWLLSIT